MNKIGKLIGIFLGSIALIIIAVVIFLFSIFGQGMCGNRISKVVDSPDQKLKIVVFERDCGATTDFSTQISILEKSRELQNESGNIFSGDSDNGNAKINDLGLIYIEPKWIDNRTILIKYDSLAAVYTSKKVFKGIDIKYKKVKSGY